MSLKYLGKMELDQHMRSLFAREKDLIQDILLAIKEIDARRLYLELGYPNLFSYLTQGVGYSEGSTQRRIDGARLLKELPEVRSMIQSGEIKLSQVAMVQKAARQVLKNHNKKVTSSEKKTLLNNLTKKNYSETQHEIARFFELPVLKETKKTRQSDGSVRLEISLSKELFEKIEKAQQLLSHSIPSGDVVKYLEYVTEKVIQAKMGKKSDLKKTKNSNLAVTENVFTKPTAAEVAAFENINLIISETKSSCDNKISIPSSLLSRRNQHKMAVELNQSFKSVDSELDSKTKMITQKTRRKILNEFQCCQYKDPITGRVCRSRWFLQIDHAQPQWFGVNHSPENLQILCGAHNRHKYLQESHRKLMS